jgi:VanZ family protein
VQGLLRKHWTTASTTLVVIYALLDEFHQSYVGSRSASIFDSLIDIAGGIFALMCFAYFRRTRRRRELPERAL